MKKLLFLWLFILGSMAYSQDILITKDGEKHEVIIKEINDKQIKYVDFKDPDGVVFTIDKVLVKEIKFHTGNKMKMKDPEENEWYFADDRINNLMFNFSAFGSNTLAFAYERAVAPGESLMLEGKFYGLGLQRESAAIWDRYGFGMTLDYRLRLKSLFQSRDQYRPLHVLHGTYISPGLGFSSGGYTTENWGPYGSNDERKYTHTIFHFGIHLGKEFVIRRRMTFDINVGMHYYVGDDSDGVIHAGNLAGSDGILLGLNIRLGFLFGKARLVDKYKNSRRRRPERYRGGNSGNPEFY